MKTAAEMLGREPFFTDEGGWEREIIGAAISQSRRLAYVESRTKDGGANPHGFGGRHIDVSIRIHQIDADGTDKSAEIESYNPFFGCDVRFFEWIGESVVLIYREKHWTFACRFGDLWPPKFVKIEDAWVIHNGQLAYISYNEESVRRLSFPSLDPMNSLPKDEADKLNLMPETYWNLTASSEPKNPLRAFTLAGRMLVVISMVFGLVVFWFSMEHDLFAPGLYPLIVLLLPPFGGAIVLFCMGCIAYSLCGIRVWEASGDECDEKDKEGPASRGESGSDTGSMDRSDE